MGLQVFTGLGWDALAGSGEGARWRVFVSHTSELRGFPRSMSYVAAVERAIAAAGHVVVDMADFPAADQSAAQLCAERVRGCEVYVGVLGTRYGSPVRDRPEVSYSELEFDTATVAGLDRLVFLLDTDAEEVGIPPAALIDREFGGRQDAFRRRVQDSGLTTRSFANPGELGQLVERSLRDLADTRARLASGIEREQVPAEPQPVRASKFVNPPPTTAPAWFQDRQTEIRLLARYVADPGIRMVTVSGRPGIGKTALVCRLLKGLESGRIPDLEGGAAAMTVGGIVYLSRIGTHQVDYPTLSADLRRLLSAQEAQRLRRIYQDPHRTPAEMMLALLEAFPVGEPVVVLLDNLESVMDTEKETLTDQALYEALIALLTAPAHAVIVIATTRVTPTALLKIEPARQHRLSLEEGLGSPHAQTVLRELDDGGHLGLRDAPEELLNGLRLHTRGFPRALEAVKAILDSDATLTPQDLLDRTRQLSEDQVVRVLVGEAYELLDAPAQQVMQALAVYPAPVSAVGVDFLLRPVNPTTDAAPILSPAGPPPADAVPGPALLPAPGRPRVRPRPAPSREPRRYPGRVHADRPTGPRCGLLRPGPNAEAILAHLGRRPGAADRVRTALRHRRLRHRGHCPGRHRLQLPASVGSLPHPSRTARAYLRTHNRPNPERHPPRQSGNLPHVPGRLTPGH